MKKSKKQVKHASGAFLFNAPWWFTDTADFKKIEKGIYIDLMALQWANKSIPEDVSRLFVASGERLPFDDSEILYKLRNVLRQDVSTESVIEILRSMSFQSFSSSWSHISKKYSPDGNGGLINKRLEQERAANEQYTESQRERTAKATAARWKNNRDDMRDGHRDDMRDGHRDDMRDGHRDDMRDGHRDDMCDASVTSSVTGTNSNSNSNNIIKKEKTRARAESVTEKNSENLKTEIPDQDSHAPREFSIHRHGSSPILIHLPGLKESFAKNIDSYLKGKSDVMLMHHKLMKMPSDLIAYIIVSYFYHLNSYTNEPNVGHIGSAWSAWCDRNFDRLANDFAASKKDLEWFNKEVENANGILKNHDYRQKYISYYTAMQPSGKMWFQTLKNFSVIDTMKEWEKKEVKASSVKDPVSTTTITPDFRGEGWTDDEERDWLMQGVIPERFKRSI